MKIHVYAICWNEEKILPFFIRHYEPIAEKIIIYDNESTDNSRKIIEASKTCIYKTYSSNNQIRDDLYTSIKNTAWKESVGHADWVFILDMDEFIYSASGVIKELKRLKRIGFSLIRPTGYNMVMNAINWDSEMQLTDIGKFGAPWPPQNKPCIFNPNQIREINYTNGAHDCFPESKWQVKKNRFLQKRFKNNLMLLHYKYLGPDYTLYRYRLMRQRLSEYNKASGAGEHYNRKDEEFVNEFKAWKEISEVII